MFLKAGKRSRGSLSVIKNVFKGEPASKHKDKAYAEKLWPLYQDCGGNAAETLRRAEEAGIEISKPTLDKLIKFFGFKEKLAQAQKNHFAASNDHSGELTSLLVEVTGLKNAVKVVLDASPNDMKAHARYGSYIGQILEIRKQMILAKAVDKNQLVIDVLKATIGYMRDCGLTAAVETVGDNLEHIVNRVKIEWDSN